GLAVARVVASLVERVEQHALVERPRGREALALVTNHADANGKGLRARERLDLALIGLHARPAAAGDDRLDLLALARQAREPRRDVEQPGHEPETVTSPMTSDTPAADIGSHCRSAPTATTSCSMRCSVDAIVNSRSGAPSWPPSMRRPSAPVEKSPDTG